jgi:hypothetical protein
MKKKFNIICPVSPDRVNENSTRVAAFFTIIITVIGLYFNSYIIFFLMALDFALRAFSDGKWSVIRNLSIHIVNLLKIKTKLIDASPKKFAAGMGMTFCLAIGLLIIFDLNLSSIIVGCVLIAAALLEGGFNFCLGCTIYTLFVQPFISKK